MSKCRHCKTGLHIRIYRARLAPGVWQDMYECRNCGTRWKKGKPYREIVSIQRKEVK